MFNNDVSNWKLQLVKSELIWLRQNADLSEYIFAILMKILWQTVDLVVFASMKKKIKAACFFIVIP